MFAKAVLLSTELPPGVRMQREREKNSVIVGAHMNDSRNQVYSQKHHFQWIEMTVT